MGLGTAKDSISSLTVTFTRVFGLMTRNRAGDHFIWTLETCIKEVGRMEKSMGLESILSLTMTITKGSSSKE